MIQGGREQFCGRLTGLWAGWTMGNRGNTVDRNDVTGRYDFDDRSDPNDPRVGRSAG